MSSWTELLQETGETKDQPKKTKVKVKKKEIKPLKKESEAVLVNAEFVDKPKTLTVRVKSEIEESGIPFPDPEITPVREILRLEINDMFIEIRELKKRKHQKTLNETRKLMIAITKEYSLEVGDLQGDKIHQKNTDVLREKLYEFGELIAEWECETCAIHLRKAIQDIVE